MHEGLVVAARVLVFNFSTVGAYLVYEINNLDDHGAIVAGLQRRPK